MSTALKFTPIENTLLLSPSAGSITSYQVSEKKGNLLGISVSVSGAGAWAKLDGSMSFEIRNLESSSTYERMKETYNIGGGVSGFWGWLGFGANANTHKEEIKEVFNEVQQSQKVEGVAKVSLFASGMYPNVAVTASAFIFVLQVIDSSGNEFSIASGGNNDIGAQDQSTNNLPTKDNNSSLTF